MFIKRMLPLTGSLLLASPAGASIDISSGEALVVFNTTGHGSYYMKPGLTVDQIIAMESIGQNFGLDVSAASAALGGSIESFAVLGIKSGSGSVYNYSEYIYVDVDGGLLYTGSPIAASNFELANRINDIQTFLLSANLGWNHEGSLGDFDTFPAMSPYLQTGSSGLALQTYTLEASTESETFSNTEVHISGTWLEFRGIRCNPSDSQHPLTTANIIEPQQGAVVEEGVEFSISVSARSDWAINYCDLYLDGAFTERSEWIGVSGSYEFSSPLTSSLPAGQRNIEVRCVDVTLSTCVADQHEVTVYADNDSTVFGDLTGSVNQGETTTGVIQATDPEGLTDGSYFTIVVLPAIGTASIDPVSGQWTYNASLLYQGVSTFTVRITDDMGFIKDQVISVTTQAVDTDFDGLTDGFETFYGFNPQVPGEEVLDGDGDGLNTLQEQDNATHPHLADTDNDTVGDGTEVSFGTDPLDPRESPLQKKYFASDVGAGDNLGHRIVIEGDTALISAPMEDGQSSSVVANFGAVYVYARSNGIWSEQQKLVASTSVEGGRFGTSIALDGDTALIGSVEPFEDNGFNAVYVFERNSGVWSQQQRLLKLSDEDFGESLALQGDTAVIGAPGELVGDNIGSVYIYSRSAGVWTEQQQLLASDAEVDDKFGSSVSISGETILIGASGVWAAYVFTLLDGSWVEQQKLIASDSAASNGFGGRVALKDNTALISVVSARVVYSFERNNGFWTERQALRPSDESDSAGFGLGLAFNENLVGIGFNNGVYLFFQQSGIFREIDKQVALDGQDNNFFGRWLALEDDTLIAGAVSDDEMGSNAGAFYVLDLDADDDGLLNDFESSYGFDMYLAGEQGQDGDVDGLTNVEEQTLGTNPNAQDTDGDGISDGDEAIAGSDPLDAASPNGFPVPYPVFGLILLGWLLGNVGRRR